MASRISHKSRRSSRSFSLLIVTRASGTAMEVRMSRIMVAMISSSSVKPCWGPMLRPRWNVDRLIVPSFSNFPVARRLPKLLLDGHGSLRAVHGDGLHAGIARSATSNGQGRLPARLRLKSHSYHRALARNSARSGWPCGRDLQGAAGFVFAVHERHSLAILREEAAVGDIDQLHPRRNVVQLHGHRINVLRPGQEQV